MSIGETLGMQAGGAVVNSALGMIGAGMGNKATRKNMKYQSDLQKDMWDYTNAENQVEHYKKAGLNVGLMYDKGGSSATTGSFGTSGHAPQMGNVDTVGGMLAESQVELNKAQANKLKAETPTSGNIGDTNISKTNTEIENLKQGINNQKAQEELTKIMQDVNELGMNETKERIRALGYENKINSQVINEKIKIIQNEAIKGVLEQAILKSQNENIKQSTEESKARVNKMTEDIAQGWQNLSIQEKNTRLKEFESNLKAEYPNIGESAGRLINELQLGLETLFGERETRYHRKTNEK